MTPDFYVWLLIGLAAALIIGIWVIVDTWDRDHESPDLRMVDQQRDARRRQLADMTHRAAKGLERDARIERAKQRFDDERRTQLTMAAKTGRRE